MSPKEVVEAWVEAFNRADAEAVAGFYAEGAVNHQVAETPIEGRPAIREMFVREFARAKMVLPRREPVRGWRMGDSGVA